MFLAPQTVGIFDLRVTNETTVLVSVVLFAPQPPLFAQSGVTDETLLLRYPVRFARRRYLNIAFGGIFRPGAVLPATRLQQEDGSHREDA
jgi:hypothetical protein